MNPLYKIVSRVLEIPEHEIEPKLEREKTTQWDSFNHLMLISEVEKELNVTIPIGEIEHINTVGDLERLVARS